jgi:transposase
MKAAFFLTLPPKNVSLVDAEMQARRTEMTKTKRSSYTLEFKLEAVRLAESGESIAAAARQLGVVEQTLFNWMKAKREGRLTGADSKPVSAEQMEISRLKAELARVKMERDILGKATAYFAKGLK